MALVQWCCGLVRILCQCLAYNPHIEGNIQKSAIQAAKDQGLAELKQDTRDLMVQQFRAEFRDEARKAALAQANT